MPLKRVDTKDLELGMVVSRLDRPWRETSFLLQGFQIQDEAELEELREQCRHVFILVADEEIEISVEMRKPVKAQDISSEIGQAHYQVTTAFEDEVSAARKSHNQVADLVAEIAAVLDADKQLDLPKVERSVDVMVGSIERNPDAFLWLSRIKKFDSEAYRQSLSASVWAATFGRHLGLKEDRLKDLATGALLMDVGYTALPKGLLNKTGRLSNEEWELVKSHVMKSMRILGRTPGLSNDVLAMVATHHERLDGSGYPEGLKAASIPLSGQIAGIVDFYTATTIPRPYSKPISPSSALQMLYRQRGQYFQEHLVDAFIQALSTYPTGSLVELSSGAVAIVSAQNPGWRLRPKLILLLDADKQSYGTFPSINLLDQTHDDRGQPLHITKTLAEGEYGLDIEELSL